MIQQKQKHMIWTAVTIGVVVVGVICVISFISPPWASSPGAKLNLVHITLGKPQLQVTDSGLFGLLTMHYVISGDVTNDGSVTSGPVTIQIQIKDGSTGAILWTTTTGTNPESIPAGQTGIYTLQFTSDDLGGAKPDTIGYEVKVLSY
jgi:hypothetical protein